jgi:hypothetical protein
VKTFFDPHPGRAGAAIRLPDVVRLVAKGMDGKEMELEKAVSILQDAANNLVADGSFGEAVVEAHDSVLDSDEGYIGLMLTEGDGDEQSYPKHSFRVIRFK